MKSLFDAILLIVSSTALFLFYYVLKKWLQNLKEKRKAQKYLRIINEEKRAQLYRSLQVALVKMERDQAFLGEIYIHGNNEVRLSIERRHGIDLWKFRVGNLNLSSEIKSELKKYGRYIKCNTSK